MSNLPIYIGSDMSDRQRFEAWRKIQEGLAKPFPVHDIQFRPQGAMTAKGQMVVAYVTARAIQDLLDELVGCENWTFDYETVSTANGTAKSVKAILVIYGVAKADLGDASKIEPEKGMVSDSEKRAGVQWGIGRLLYRLPGSRAYIQKLDADGRVPLADLKRLRKILAAQMQEVAEGREPVEEEAPVLTTTATTATTATPPAMAPATAAKASSPVPAATPVAPTINPPNTAAAPLTDEQKARLAKIEQAEPEFWKWLLANNFRGGINSVADYTILQAKIRQYKAKWELERYDAAKNAPTAPEAAPEPVVAAPAPVAAPEPTQAAASDENETDPRPMSQATMQQIGALARPLGLRVAELNATATGTVLTADERKSAGNVALPFLHTIQDIPPADPKTKTGGFNEWTEGDGARAIAFLNQLTTMSDADLMKAYIAASASRTDEVLEAAGVK